MHAKGEQSRHDWHSADYVDGWIAKDERRGARRQPILARMTALIPFAADAPIRVLDVAGGYGAVSAAVLAAFPKARVTLHDYSEVMLERARRYFADAPGPVTYVQGDLTDPAWTQRVGRPFELVVSGIAIHNLEEPELIGACYRSIHSLLTADGVFLNCDHFERAGGIEENLSLLKEAGYARVDAPWHEPPTGIIRGLQRVA